MTTKNKSPAPPAIVTPVAAVAVKQLPTKTVAPPQRQTERPLKAVKRRAGVQEVLMLRAAILMVLASLSFGPGCSRADMADILGQFTGYTIVAVKTVAGYIDEDGKRSDDFEGCDFNRKILFDDGTSLTCSSYSYEYEYRPEAVILEKATQAGGRTLGQIVMVVSDDSYEMQSVILN